MEVRSLFTSISAESQREMARCFEVCIKRFAAGETLFTYADSFQKIGILQNGRAHLSCMDLDGRESRLEELQKNDVFGELFTLPLEGMAYYVKADKDCEVLFIDYPHLIKRCEKACAHHSQLVNNLFWMAAHKAQALTFHLSVLSQRTLRQKLLAYFKAMCQNGSCNLPMSWSALADYLCVDRSAMMRELSRMRQAHLLAIDGRQVHLLSSDF